MKGNRPIGPAKTPVRIPPDAIAPDHLPAVAAFERWQRELPKAAAFVTNDRSRTSTLSGEAPKH
jgi:hypothetical protein